MVTIRHYTHHWLFWLSWYSLGDCPVQLLKAVQKELDWLYPSRSDISVIDNRESCR